MAAKRRVAKAAAPMPFSRKLVLNRWMLSLFGAEKFEGLAEQLRDESLEGLDENNVHHFHHRLVSASFELADLSAEQLSEYDQNIVRHTNKLNEKRITSAQLPIRWKYFQYLTLLFTEIYLDRYFRDPKQLLEEINQTINKWNTLQPAAERVTPFDPTEEAWSQLNKLSFWSATGSGKTLMMHANVLQYRHYLELHGKTKSLNRTILLTPNEGLSKQHVDEFAAAGLAGYIFNKDSLRQRLTDNPIDILEVTKLGDAMGDKTVAVEAFEGNNLVLVDEGHRGASSGSGGSWMRHRNALCENGFSFEYSATFGQALKGNKELTDIYAKSILVDYSYRFFHGDGFGKDYYILNLDGETEKNHRKDYLVACLLTFFQQQRVFEKNGGAFKAFNVEKPLWVFVGGSVTAKVGKQESADIVEILKFFAEYVKNPSASIKSIERVLGEGIVNANEKNVFAGRFGHLKGSELSAAEIFNETLSSLFNAPAGGQLHLEHRKGSDGEIALRIGENTVFGVINVGDSSGLLKLCASKGLQTGDGTFKGSLFQGINDDESPVNVLIGAKKFTEGWSSWRVSTFGLMNVGKSEGAQIIQLFGRGVRLKGHAFSLKRSDRAKLPGGLVAPAELKTLETLNVFGVKADYMAQFNAFLVEEKQGEEEFEEFLLPVIRNLGKAKGRLKTVRLKETVNGVRTAFGEGFRKLAPVPTLRPPNEEDTLERKQLLSSRVVVNWYPKILFKTAKTAQERTEYELNEEKLKPAHVALLDIDALYFALEREKAETGRYNFNLTQDGIKALLDSSDWYTLYIPKAALAFDSYEKVRVWQEVAFVLLKKYAARYYHFRKSEWEAPHLEYRMLEEDDPNLLGSRDDPENAHHRVLYRPSDTELLRQLKDLERKIRDGVLNDWSFGNLKEISFGRHLYRPLIVAGKGSFSISPVPLDASEGKFVEDLAKFHDSSPETFENRELYLLRNLSRGKGVGFFEAGNFHPDFILWLLNGPTQHIAFVDPKGLRNIGEDDPKIRFHKTIKDTEARLGDPNVHLYSFIVSNTAKSDLLWLTKDKNELAKKNVLLQENEHYVRDIIEKILAPIPAISLTA